MVNSVNTDTTMFAINLNSLDTEHSVKLYAPVNHPLVYLDVSMYS